MNLEHLLAELVVGSLADKVADRVVHKLDPRFDHIIQHLHSLMSKITDYTDAVQASFAAINTSLDDIKDDITNLTNQIGQLDPTDAAALQKLKDDAAALQAKADAIDAVTPPPAPTP